MTARVVVAAAAAFSLLAVPALAQGWSGAEHADRMAAELALKRAQLRAERNCGRTASTLPAPASPPATATTSRTANFPPGGSGGPIPAPGLCGR